MAVASRADVRVFAMNVRRSITRVGQTSPTNTIPALVCGFHE
jgi:hypothetical protein